VIENLPSKREVLSSNPSTTEGRKGGREGGREENRKGRKEFLASLPACLRI
jgi:hypothetical protein